MQRTTDFWVGDRVVRPSIGEIRLGIERIHLEPRSMQVLLALAARAPEVVLKQDLIDEVWGEKFVSDEVLTHAIWDLRRAFGDQASNPEFIQTIPKRGYRLIAPVKDLEASGEEGEEPASAPPPVRRLLVAGLAAVVLLAAASIWLATSRPSAPRSPPRPNATILTLVPASPSDGASGWAKELDRQLLAELAGAPGLEIRQEEQCPTASEDEPAYCLEPLLLPHETAYQARAQLRETPSLEVAYATPFVALPSRAELSTGAHQIADLAGTFLEVVGRWDLDDPDIRPWISLQDHDIRAIRDFLLGLDYVYRNEIGGRDPLASAIAIDPEFVAPWVWKAPTIAEEPDASTRAEHRAKLEDLYHEATAFEKAMIGWAKAKLDDQPADQIRQLRVALELEPENRPVRMVTTIPLMTMGSLDAAWEVLDGLLEERWCHPALFPVAAQCALARDNPEDARRALEGALECKPVDPGSLALLRLLAVFADDAAAETHYGEWFERRMREMLPETPDIDVSGPAAQLIALAEADGRKEIVPRLREFLN